MQLFDVVIRYLQWPHVCYHIHDYINCSENVNYHFLIEQENEIAPGKGWKVAKHECCRLDGKLTGRQLHKCTIYASLHVLACKMVLDGDIQFWS